MAADDAELRQRFLSEAPDAWRSLRSLAVEVKAKVRERSRNNNPRYKKAPSWVVLTEYNGYSGSLRCVTRQLEGSRSGEQKVLGLNPRYSFLATQKSEDKPLSILRASPSDADNVRELLEGPSRQTLLGDQKNIIFLPIMLQYIPVDELVAGPGFTLTQVSKAPGAEPGLVEVHYESTDVYLQDYKYKKGQLILDPSHLWAIRDFDLDMDIHGEVRIKGRNEYGDVVEGFPAIRKHTLEMYSPPDPAVEASRIFEFEEFGAGSVRPEDCTCSAFGIPEPGFVKSGGGWGWGFVAVNIACVVGLVSAIGFFRSRKAANKRPS